MPNYLNAGPENAYALNRLGSTFSDMVIGLQLNRQRQQQFMTQQAMEQARLQIEQEAQRSNELTARSNREKLGAETDYYKARSGSERLLGEAGGMLGDVLKGRAETDPTKNPDVYNFLTAIAAQQGGRIAAQSPGQIGRQIPELMSLNDPIIRNLIATQSPATVTASPGSTVLDLTRGGVPMFTAPQRASLRTPEQESSEQLRALGAVTSDLGRAHQLRTPQGTNAMNALNMALSKVPGGQQATQVSPAVPKPGDVYKGYRFKGGDPSDKNSWEQAQ